MNQSQTMNEAETRAELIDPKLIECGWGVNTDTKILREFHITKGKIKVGGERAKPLNCRLHTYIQKC